jgi:hypothetical protein
VKILDGFMSADVRHSIDKSFKDVGISLGWTVIVCCDVRSRLKRLGSYGGPFRGPFCVPGVGRRVGEDDNQNAEVFSATQTRRAKWTHKMECLWKSPMGVVHKTAHFLNHLTRRIMKSSIFSFVVSAESSSPLNMVPKSRIYDALRKNSGVE